MKTESNRPKLRYIIPERYHGETVSTALRQGMGCSGSLIKQVKYDGLLLGGEKAVLSDRVSAGDCLTVYLPEDPPSDIAGISAPLDIVFEDEHLLIVNKAAGVAVHPGPDHHEDSLGNFITAHYEAKGEHHLYRPVNRLDRGTSGLMAVAKHAYAQERLRQQLHGGGFQRMYTAICDGIPQPRSGTICAPIGRLDGSVIARTVRADGAAAVTHYETLRVSNTRAWVRLRLETGRTHQIRVHMAHIGCPLTGDFLYGRECPEVIGRAALHSCALSLVHPVTGERMHFEVDMPEDMVRLMESEKL